MVEVFFSAWCLNCGYRGGQVDLNKRLVLPPLGKASEACRWESTCRSKRRAMGQLANTGGGVQSSLRILGNPRNPIRFLGARKWHGAQQQNGRGGEGEVETAFKPGLPSEGADNKEAAKVSDAREGAGCVKLTAALNPSSWKGLDAIRPAQPRPAWQGLSCRRHQRADEDGGQSLRPPCNSTNL